jgi:hypothetical protein
MVPDYLFVRVVRAFDVNGNSIGVRAIGQRNYRRHQVTHRYANFNVDYGVSQARERIAAKAVARKFGMQPPLECVWTPNGYKVCSGERILDYIED